MSQVKIVEVGPRDGLQNISKIVPTKIKIELIERLVNARLSAIEVTSFVSPKWIPQLADGKQVLEGIRPLLSPTQAGIQFPVLVPNLKGLEAAHGSGAKEVVVFVSATEGFSKKNINCTVEESLKRVREITDRARSLGIRVRAYVSCIFEDPYDGPTDPNQVIRVTKFLIDAGCYEVSLGDTLGVGTPADVERLFRAITKCVPADRLAGHFHDTYGQAVANVVKAYELGIRTFDSSVAGLGGCPFAKGAKGNLSTEDLVYTLEKMGVSTGVDLDLLVATGEWISRQLQISNESRAGRAISAKTVGVTQIGAHPKPLNRTWSVLESDEDLRVSRSGTSINICLTAPKKGNALTTSVIHALIRLFRRFSDDERILHIILSAEGRFFCTGMDLKNTGTPEQQFAGLKELFHTIDSCPKTTIALVNGPCFGGGVGLVFVCDIRLVTADTTFKLSEVQLGLCPAIISKYVIREWGIAFARTAMLTASIVGPRELAEIHAIHHIVTDRAALNVELNKLLDDLRFAAPRASSLCKKLISAAWTDAGGQNQNATIEWAFHQMMARGSESEYALEEFRRGAKTIDWAKLAIETPLHAEAKL